QCVCRRCTDRSSNQGLLTAWGPELIPFLPILGEPTLHCYMEHCEIHQTCWARPPNHVIQVFQSPPWTQVYTIKPPGMQTASTNIGERMGRSQELSDSKRGPVIGGHLGNKSIRDISWLLNIPRSTVSGIITKWKQLGTTATQPPSGRPRHMTGRGQRMLKRTVRRSHQLSAESIAKDLQTWCDLQMSPTTVCRELHGMGFHGRAAASK
ncbi:unnamed protein product, partial [Staurois parvus]